MKESASTAVRCPAMHSVAISGIAISGLMTPRFTALLTVSANIEVAFFQLWPCADWSVLTVV